MRVLLINKFHYQKRGAERAYLDTAQVLADHGHDLAFFAMKHPKNKPSRWSKYFVSESNYEAGYFNIFKNIKAVINIWYNFGAKRKLEKLIREFKPDVAHLHNIYHQLSPAIINILEKYKIPMVMTLHDYKLVSPAYNLSVRGRIWEKDKGGKLNECLKDRVVKNSFLKTLVCVIEYYLHRFLRIYQKIDLFISPSEFLMNKFREYGFKGKIIKLPNPIIINHENIKEPEGQEDFILYYGGLSAEKGIDDLIEALARLDEKINLKIIGEGLEREKLEKITKDMGLSDQVEFLGFKPRLEALGYARKSLFVVVPSHCYENSPYTALEPMSLGKPVIAPRLGSLKEIIKDKENGLLYESENIDDLANKIKHLFNDRELRNKMGDKAKKMLSLKYSQEFYYSCLHKIYSQLVDKKSV